MILWNSDDVEQATGGRSTLSWSAIGVSIDSRTLSKGDLFFALKDQRDGHDFVRSAFDAGAAAAVVSRIPPDVQKGSPLVIVPNVQDALSRLGAAGRDRFKGKLIAVTGSVGKTSTKDMLSLALGCQGTVHAAAKSYNNQWGVPLTLARMPPDADFAGLEIGMNGPGEIAPLSRLARPNVAMITAIAPAHLAAFDSLDEIAAEKATIVSGMIPEGVAVLNSDTPGYETTRNHARMVSAKTMTFGTRNRSSYRLLAARVFDHGTIFEFEAKGRLGKASLTAHGTHFAKNALGALACIDAIGADEVRASRDLREWRPSSGRGDRHRISLKAGEPSLLLVDDAFNANPTSLLASLETLVALEPPVLPNGSDPGRRVAVLGDMLELGKTERDLHLEIANLDAIRKVQVIHCAGTLMRNLHEALPFEQRGYWRPTAEELLPLLKKLVRPGDIVLVKGSKGSRISVVADGIRRIGRIEAREK